MQAERLIFVNLNKTKSHLVSCISLMSHHKASIDNVHDLHRLFNLYEYILTLSTKNSNMGLYFIDEFYDQTAKFRPNETGEVLNC